MSERNEYSDKSTTAVYLVSYTYMNIGCEDANGIMDGLFFVLNDSIVDSAGQMGYNKLNNVTDYAT